MKTDTQQYETLPPIVYDVNLATIAKLNEKYKHLNITDINDIEQFDAVHDGRMIMVKVRTTIEKERVAKKATAIKYGKDVDAAAKVLFDASGPTETRLKTEENKVLDERKRVQEEKERLEKVKIQSRVDALGEYKLMLPFFDVAAMTDAEFEVKLAEARETWEAEQKRLEAEEKAREELGKKLEAERAELAKVREEQAKQAQVQAAERLALETERQKIEAGKKAAIDRENRAIFEKEAAEKAKVQAEKDSQAKVEREAKEKVEAEEAAKIEAIRQEKIKPTKVLLLEYAIRIDNVQSPSVDGETAFLIVNEAMLELSDVANKIRKEVEVL